MWHANPHLRPKELVPTLTVLPQVVFSLIKLGGRVIRKLDKIFITYKEVYQIHGIEVGCNYSLFVDIYCISPTYNVIYESGIFSINYICIIIIEPKCTMACLEPV